MSTIYIVKETVGEYEDYWERNLRAFYNKDEAQQYMRKLVNITPPKFVTPKFEDAFNSIELPDWDSKPLEESNSDWSKRNVIRENKLIIEEMSKKGFSITEQMIDEYYNWQNQKEDSDNYYMESIQLI